MKPVLTDPVARAEATSLLNKMWFLSADIDSLGDSSLKGEMVDGLCGVLETSMINLLTRLGVDPGSRREALDMLDDGHDTWDVIKQYGSTR